ncbi:hypothetical protein CAUPRSCDRAFT_1605, partial [Caulochytrium protostelioides]
VIAALYEGRGITRDVGIAVLSLTSTSHQLFQFADTAVFTKTLRQLQIVHPVEIVLAESLNETAANPTSLRDLVEAQLPDARLFMVPRRSFNERLGREWLSRYCRDELVEGLMVTLESKTAALAAFAALLHYITETQNIGFLENSMIVVFHASEGMCFIDASTARILELVTNHNHAKDAMHFLSSISHVKTNMGARLLRSNILQPLCDANTLEGRLDAVEEIMKSADGGTAVRQGLENLLNMDQTLTVLLFPPAKPNLAHAEQLINTVIALKHVLLTIQPLAKHTESFRSEVLAAIHSVLTDSRVEAVRDLVNATVSDEVAWQTSPIGMRNQRCYCVKTGCNGLLDVARQTYRETSSDVYELVEQYNARYSRSFKIAYTSSMRFYLTDAEASSAADLPDEFINCVQKGKQLTFTTLELLSLNNRLNESLTEVYLLSDSLIMELVEQIQPRIGILCHVSESLALLDVLASFAFDAQRRSMVRPEFTDTLAIKGGRHPILDAASPTLVANDTYCSGGANVQIITGPNMSGKSTYLRQIGLLNIMAQIGSYVPAEYCSVRLAKRIAARMGNDDDLEGNASSFMLEMREMAAILHGLGPTDVILIDELGRGTGLTEGMALTYAICAHFAQQSAFVFLATHFLDLADTLGEIPSIVNLHFQVQVHPDREVPFRFLHSLGDHPSSITHYGLDVAAMAQMDPVVIGHARSI